MTIYFPESVLKLPLIKKAAEMLNLHAEEYDVPELDLKESPILDPVKNFLSLYLEDGEDINFFAQTFYSVKGTRKVIEFLYKYGFLNNQCKIVYKSTKKLEIRLGGIIQKLQFNFQEGSNRTIKNNYGKGEEINYCSVEYINRFREFLKSLLYFGYLDIFLDTLTININLNNNGGLFGDADFYIIEKALE